MQIIQTIRDRGTVIMAVLIVLCLLGFILMDSSHNGGGLFGGGNHTVIGKVNGTSLDVNEFNKKMNTAEEMAAQQSGQKPTGAQLNQIRDNVWNQMIGEQILFKEAGKLGIEFTPKELSSILLSNDQSNPLLQDQSLMDPTTGKLDMAKAQQALAQIKKSSNEQRDAINARYIEPLKLNTIAGKYNGLLMASAYYPSWMKEKDNNDANQFANISYVSIPYTEILDSAVKVTDADINAYVAKNKELFKQEAGRKISYITVSQSPSAADTAAIRNTLLPLVDKFREDTAVAAFVASNGSITTYDNQFHPKSKLPISANLRDSVLKGGVGSVFGPYVDQGAYILAKIVASKPLPDSVNARHILIGTHDAQSGKETRPDDVAKKLADSLLAAINSGANFGQLVTQYSDDPGSKEKGGLYENISYGQMVPEFNDFIFEKPVGSKAVVKTQFGYHIIEVMNQKSINNAYKIAFLAKDIIASDETVNAANLLATKASASKNGKELADFAAKNGLTFVDNPTIIKENDFAVGQAIPDGRQIVKWAFDNDKGKVSEPFSADEKFVVATIDNIYKEGVQDAATARAGAEAIVRKQKKAAIIKQKIGANPTLETAAAAYNKQIQVAGADSTLTFASQMINGLGLEPKLIGAAFNKDFQSKPTPAIEGTVGVYVMKVNSVQAKAANPELEAQQETGKMNQLRQQAGNWFDGLKKMSEIKDNRSKFF